VSGEDLLEDGRQLARIETDVSPIRRERLPVLFRRVAQRGNEDDVGAHSRVFPHRLNQLRKCRTQFEERNKITNEEINNLQSVRTALSDSGLMP
jgi:hypothetical protein